MTVSKEIETYIHRLNLNFEVKRNKDVLEFFVRPEAQNKWFSIKNIRFDYDNELAKIKYTLDDENYICSANINNEEPLDFSPVNFLIEKINVSLSIKKILVLIISFNREYAAGRSLKLFSQNERSFKTSNLQINYKKEKN